VKFWLATRQVRHVAQHRDTVPPLSPAPSPLPAHQKAADYTIAKARFGLIELAWGTPCCSAGPCSAGSTR
jgi:STE24 endopeptidase